MLFEAWGDLVTQEHLLALFELLQIQFVRLIAGNAYPTALALKPCLPPKFFNALHLDLRPSTMCGSVEHKLYGVRILVFGLEPVAAHLKELAAWWHADPRGMGAVIEQVVNWGAALARGEQPADRAPVRLFVMGIDEWRDFDQWPPAGYSPQRWYLRSGGLLDRAANPASLPSTFIYGPNDPTPSLGGPKLDANGLGPKDNRPLEKRSDVLTFTSAALTSDLEVIGEVSAQVWLRTDRPSCDLFVRLCDVDERGRSMNICDDLVTVQSDGLTKVTVQLSPTTHVFRRGHRLRVQVSGGAFPRFARNLGGGEPVATAKMAYLNQIEIMHDDMSPSAIILPMR